VQYIENEKETPSSQVLNGHCVSVTIVHKGSK